MTNAVYKLYADLDDAHHVGLATEAPSFLGNPFIIDDFIPESVGVDQQAPRLRNIWKPIEVVGRVNKGNDFPCLNLLVPAFSQRAVNALHDLLEPNGELLPLQPKDVNARFYAYNVTTYADVLDRERSIVTWMTDDPGPWDARAIHISHFEFIEEQLNGLIVFCIPELAAQPFVTQTFVDRIAEAGLGGFKPECVWKTPV